MKIAVVGAGLSGLMVANRLSRLGMDVTVFEKSRGLGGRIATKRLEWGALDIGAQYFTVRDPRFRHQVQQWLEEGATHLWDFTPYSLSSTGLKASADKTERFVGSPQMNSLAHSLAKGFKLEFEAKVDQVKRRGNKWILDLSQGGSVNGEFDWVVVSAPAEQSQAIVRDTAIALSFFEPFYIPCWALAIATKGAVNPEIQGIFGDEMVSWVSRLSSRPQRIKPKHYDDCWMIHFSSEWSIANGKETQIDITRTGFDWLAETLNNHGGKELSVVEHHKHFWRYARVRKNHNQQSFLVDSTSHIALVGDWLCGGRIEGAFLSALNFTDFFIQNTDESLGEVVG